MRTALLSATLAVAASAAAVPSPPTLGNIVNGVTNAVTGLVEEVCEALPLEAFNTKYSHKPVPIEEAKIKLDNYSVKYPIHFDFPQFDKGSYQPYKAKSLQSGARCANPRVRVEWDRMNNGDRQKYMDGVKCLLNRAPSGQWPNAKNRYEDLVSLHQRLTPNVHGNDKFMLWHRVLVFLFETTLRNECGFDGPLPWFDETRYAGRFAQSSIFSSQWYGGIAINGACVGDGQFANLPLNIGPGDGATRHCLARSGDGSLTAHCDQEYQDLCARYPDYSGLTRCVETGYHAYGHNGIGAVMSDVQCSPSDPVFWLHHAYIDRSLRLYTNRNPQWLTQINGVDRNGNPLTLDTTINTYGMMPDFRIRDILDTLGPSLCYRYDY